MKGIADGFIAPLGSRVISMALLVRRVDQGAKEEDTRKELGDVEVLIGGAQERKTVEERSETRLGFLSRIAYPKYCFDTAVYISQLPLELELENTAGSWQLP